MNRSILKRVGFSLLGLLTLWACVGETPKGISPYDKLTSAIIGGQPDSRYPAIGSLQARRNSFCTGTLIASRLVLTAAHCITSAKQQQQRGIKIEFRVDTPAGGSVSSKYFEVTTLETHPQYGRTQQGLVNDIGYAVLKNDATGVSPLPLNTAAMGNNWVNRKILFLGYGVIQTQPTRRAAPSKYGVEITLRTMQSDRFRTQDSGKSICSGDSGGPALYNINGSITLIGVNSYVTGRSSSAGPICDGSGWSFRVDKYITWLQPLISQHGGKCKTDADCGPCYRCDAAAGKCQLKGTTKNANFCKPCSSPSDCGSGNKDICFRESAGNRCYQACDANGCCPLGTSCQQIAGQSQCVPDSKSCPAVQCTKDTDCGPGEGCNNGQCKPKPVPPSAKLCKKCASNADCDKGATCRDYPDGKYCTQPCVADNFCPNGYSCQNVSGTRQCVPNGGNCRCKATADCHSGFTCQKNICQRQGGGKYGDACDGTRKCATGYNCLSGQCYQQCQGEFPPSSPGSVCRSGRCASGTQCLGVSGYPICLQRCTSDANCTRGGTCRQFGNVRLCTCSQDSDCKSGNACNKSVFQQFATCAPKAKPTKCDNGFDCIYAGGSSERCVPPPTQGAGESCDSVKRCKDGMTCARTSSGGSTCLRRCTSSSQCTEGGNCSRTNAGNICLCNPNTACKDGNICKSIFGSTGVCSTGKCTKDSECGNGRKCVNGKCESQQSGCQSDNDCPRGTVCKATQCVPESKPDAPTPDAGPQDNPVPPGCRTDADCPPNQLCTNGQCTNPTPPDVPATPDNGNGGCQDDSDCTNGRCIGGKCIPTQPTPDTSTPTPDDVNKNVDGIKQGQDNTNKPPTNGCTGCSINETNTPTPGNLWFLLLLVVPFLRRKRQ